MKKFDALGLLPFVSLGVRDSVSMGPVTFWKASKFRFFLKSLDQKKFNEYIQAAGTFSTFDQKRQTVLTERINPEDMTCISIGKKCADSRKGELAVDAVYLLHFSCCVGSYVVPIDSYMHIWNVDKNYLITDRWKSFKHYENQKEAVVTARTAADFLIVAFGRLLNSKYKGDLKKRKVSERLVRAIQYFEKSFFQKRKLGIEEYLIGPDQIVFAVTALEALFDVNGEYQKQKKIGFQISNREILKEKLKSSLAFGNTKPESILNKWVDDFYDWRNEIVHGKQVSERVFVANPSFKIHHMNVAYLLFIKSLYFELQRSNFLSGQVVDYAKYTVENRILSCFWTELDLLDEILRDLVSLKKVKTKDEYLKVFFPMDERMQLFTRSYGSMRDAEPEYVVAKRVKVKKIVTQIQNLFEKEINIGNGNVKLKQLWISNSSAGTPTDIFLNDLSAFN